MKKLVRLLLCIALATVACAQDAATKAKAVLDRVVQALQPPDAPTSIADITALDPAAITAWKAAVVEGVVLAAVPTRNWAFIHDGTGSMLIDLGARPTDVKSGDKIRVEGPVGMGTFQPYIRAMKVTPIGKGDLPAAERVPESALRNPASFPRWVEVEGAVFEALTGPRITRFSLRGEGETLVEVNGILDDATRESFVGQRVRVRGIAWPTDSLSIGRIVSPDISHVEKLGRSWRMMFPRWLPPALGGAALAALLAFIFRRMRQSAATTKLTESELKFRLLFERNADAILLLDSKSFQFVDCNAATVAMLRARSKEEVCSTHPAALSPEVQPDGQTSREKADWIIQHITKVGAYRFEWMHRRFDGEDFLVEVSLTAVQIGELPLIVTVWREIGEQKRAEHEIRELNSNLEARVRERTAELECAQAALAESEQKFRLLFERTADAILLYDGHTMQFVDANAAAVSLFRAENRERILAAHPWQLSPPRQADGSPSERSAVAMTAEAAARGVHRFEWMHRTFSGADFPCEVTLTSIQLGDRPLMTAVLRDITERKRAEAELQRNLQRARELNDLKSNFVSMVSHEFRTPLGVIGSSAQILDRYLARLDDDGRREHLENITSSVKRMAGMMEDVLVLSRVDSGRMEFRPAPVALGDLCRRIADEMHSAHGGVTTIRIVPTADEPARADESLIRHILTNLLTNAHKYSPPGAPVELGLAREGGDAVFTIRDEGIGIPETDQARLFEAFHRGGNVGHVAGTGLGLVIVRRCAEIHGGSVSVSSAEGKGATFTVRLPVW